MSELDQTAEERAVASVEAAVDDSFLSRKADLKGGANEAKAKKDGENCCQCKENSDCTDSTACECDDCDEDCKRTTAWVFATPLLIPTIPVAILLKEMINKTYALDRYLRNHLTWPEDELIPSVTGSLGLGELHEERVLTIDPEEGFTGDAAEVTDENSVVIKNVSDHYIQLKASGDVSDRAHEKQRVNAGQSVTYRVNYDLNFQNIEPGNVRNITFHVYNPSGNQIEKKIFVLKRNK